MSRISGNLTFGASQNSVPTFSHKAWLYQYQEFIQSTKSNKAGETRWQMKVHNLSIIALDPILFHPSFISYQIIRSSYIRTHPITYTVLAELWRQQKHGILN